MGGETSAIQRVAGKISDDIFSVFKWDRAARADMNWDCCQEAHSKKTHPSDVVFFYIDPYEEEMVYLNTDLKSYAEGTIGKKIVEGALTSLALATECANVSEEWRLKYVHDDSLGYNVRGLLFLYNHDNLYDKDFYENITKKLDHSSINCPPNIKLHLLDPYKISDLINISSDITKLIGSGKLPQPDKFTYYYPDLSLTRIKHPINQTTPATIELLTSPYIIIKHEAFSWLRDKKPEGYVVYYNQPGDSVDEFVYFFDMLSTYQILTEGKPIVLRHCHIHPNENAIHHFERAKKKYSTDWLLGEDERLFLKIDFDKTDKIVVEYNLEQIGMEQR
ncbi:MULTISPECIES: hypothetical protein [Enterobacteriaceae]|uniref:hypothetical protein n=1 Tax=Enterobacteriaceae TaxID=543 RepID=UPI00032FBBD4|nr:MULTISPECIES: hypothetical protein [Enterobacteriaceae]EOQ21999.1 hypothetical protein WC1_03253 [Citrobacter sp. KTE30]MCF7270873.1 hypothetical protein [Escherichia coli]HDC1495563.1 hypothetical protein [Salmonella enterica]